MLYFFALADTRGRRTRERGRPEENLHLWKLAAEESDRFTQPYRFGNDQARVLYFRRPGSDRHHVPHEEYRCTVTMLSGLPGGGKDTWLTQYRPDLPVVSLDDLRGELDVDATDDQGRVVQLARERCREWLRARTSFAFNATNGSLRMTAGAASPRDTPPGPSAARPKTAGDRPSRTLSYAFSVRTAVGTPAGQKNTSPAAGRTDRYLPSP